MAKGHEHWTWRIVCERLRFDFIHRRFRYSYIRSSGWPSFFSFLNKSFLFNSAKIKRCLFPGKKMVTFATRWVLWWIESVIYLNFIAKGLSLLWLWLLFLPFLQWWRWQRRVFLLFIVCPLLLLTPVFFVRQIAQQCALFFSLSKTLKGKPVRNICSTFSMQKTLTMINSWNKRL